MTRRTCPALIVAGLVTLAGCSSASHSTTSEPTTSASPSAPSAPSTSPAPDAIFAPEAFAIDPEGHVVFSDCEAQRVFRVVSKDQVEVVAGSGPQGFDGGDFAGDGGPATGARLNCPSGLAFDDAGNLFVADSVNNRVRMIDTSGIISTVAGSGTTGIDAGGYVGDGGAATDAELEFPVGVAFDAQGLLYITDKGNDVIRRVDANGTISTIAGTGHGSFSGDGGPAIEAELHSPWYLVFDREGNLFFTDRDNARIRMIDTDGVISTIAGGGTRGAHASTVPALQAAFVEPYGLTIDRHGRLFVSDDIANVIRVIDGGTVSTMAGTGKLGSFGDGGPASDAQLSSPFGLLMTPEGDLYVADGGNGCVRMIDPTGVISSVVCR
jgi:sugar lactone lactonase YvrE